VVLAVLVRVPFSRRSWALPLLLRLYRNEKECVAKGVAHRKKTELGSELLDLFVSWVGERRVEVVADAAYCNDTVLRGLSPTVTMVGAMRPDAVLTALPMVRPHVRGRRPVRGEVLPKPEALAIDERTPWQRTSALLYGQRQVVYYKSIVAQWYRACGARLLHIVVVRVDTGRIKLRVFFSTDPAASVRTLLESYAGRWNIEVCFRELKQLLGFADSSARKRAAVERTAPFVALIYTTLVTWLAQGAHRAAIAAPPPRPWYTHKCSLSFADVLRAAQRTLASLDVLDPARPLDNLHLLATAKSLPSRSITKLAA
jgi:hypothetical protein